MKIVLTCFVVVLTVLLGAPAQAQELLVLYDDFEAEFINPAKWFGAQSGNLLDVAREIHGKPGSRQLGLLARAFGATGPTPGDSPSRLRSQFTNPAAVTTIKATVRVREGEAEGCPGNPTPTRVQARISGFFFNTGATPPPPGNGINDVFAFVRIVRSSDSTDPEGVLQVRAVVLHCGDPNCNGGTVLLNGDLGLMEEKGPAATLRMKWDKDANEFIFQRDDSPEVVLNYGPLSDTFGPGINQKRLEIAHEVANCPTAVSAAFMEVLFDDVFVNAPSGP